MRDLTNIPDRFHILFTSDWNKGNESKMSSTMKSEMNNLYLEYNRWNIQQAIQPKTTQDNPNNPVGFVKD
jgi:hypothetical protein